MPHTRENFRQKVPQGKHCLWPRLTLQGRWHGVLGAAMGTILRRKKTSVNVVVGKAVCHLPKTNVQRLCPVDNQLYILPSVPVEGVRRDNGKTHFRTAFSRSRVRKTTNSVDLHQVIGVLPFPCRLLGLNVQICALCFVETPNSCPS